MDAETHTADDAGNAALSAPKFVHIFQPPSRHGAPTLLLLHGTGGDERDLIPVGEQIDANAAILSVRGQVLENGMPRFFRRIAMGVLDEDDLRARATGLASFVTSCAAEYGFAMDGVVAVGFSNGANIASAVMWDHPGVLRRAVLLRAMLPYREREAVPRSGASVFLSEGSADPLVPQGEVELLSSRLRAAGVQVTTAWQEAGHNLVQKDIQDARSWLVDYH